jgi:hypothetical protein
MYIRSESSGDDRKAIANRLAQAVSDHIVADAPSDHDEVMATVPRSSGWVSALVGASAVIGLWTLIILAAGAALRH